MLRFVTSRVAQVTDRRSPHAGEFVLAVRGDDSPPFSRPLLASPREKLRPSSFLLPGVQTRPS